MNAVYWSIQAENNSIMCYKFFLIKIIMQNKWKIFANVWAFVFLYIFCSLILSIYVLFIRWKKSKTLLIFNYMITFHINLRYFIFLYVSAYVLDTKLLYTGQPYYIILYLKPFYMYKVWITSVTRGHTALMIIHFSFVMKCIKNVKDICTYIQFVVHCNTTIHLALDSLSPHILLLRLYFLWRFEKWECP